jgi:TonB family protein
MWLGLLLVTGLVQAPTPAVQEAWPPEGVLQLSDGVSRPAVLSRVEARYTAAAIRRQLQGFVTLQFVVEPDGTVGPVRVLTSLNAETGLDGAAIEALRQWRFSPGLKDGAPVRVMAIAQLIFAIGGAPPPITLPAGFEAAPENTGRWSRSEITANGVRMQYQLPEGWDAPDSPAVAVMMQNPKTLRSAAIYRPATLPRPIPFPMPLAELARFAGVMSNQFRSAAAPADVVSVGQSTFGNADWIWLELSMNDTGHAWAFAASVGSQIVQVLCSVITPTLRMTAAERDAEVAGARIDCANIIKRVTLSPQAVLDRRSVHSTTASINP